MPTVKRIACKFASTDGAEIAEAAMVLPLVFMLIMGIVWFGRAFNIYSTIQQAAQQGAIAAARDACATCAATNNATLASNAVVAVMKASNLDTSQIQAWQPAFSPCPVPAPAGLCSNSGPNVWVCRSVLVNSSGQPAQCGAVVSFQYPFTFYVPYTSINHQVVMSAQAQSRMEN
ncbi:MAG: TadE family protein [Terriglobales bacterium]